MRTLMLIFMLGLFMKAYGKCDYCGDQRGKVLSQYALSENLDDSDFTGAQLDQVLFVSPSKQFSAKGAIFDYANLEKSVFSRPVKSGLYAGSSWKGVDFRYANLKEAKFLQSASIGLALINDRTKFSENFELVRPGSAFLNIEMLGTFSLLKNRAFDKCMVRFLCFRRHPLLKSENVGVTSIDVGPESGIVFNGGIRATIPKDLSEYNDEIFAANERGDTYIYPLLFTKGTQGLLSKESSGQVVLKVWQNINKNTYSRSFKLEYKGHFKRSLKDKKKIIEGYLNWKKDSGHLIAESPVQKGLTETFDPSHYLKKKSGAEINVGLVYYGNFWNEKDLERVGAILKRRFAVATDDSVKLNIVYKESLPYKHSIEDYPNYTNGSTIDKNRLQRLWYYDHVRNHVLSEAYFEFKKTPKGKTHYKDIDALLMITGAQFEGLAFQMGKITGIEQPREAAWSTSDGGRTIVVPDEEIVDGLIHELGHTMFLGHASSQCWGSGMSYEEKQACCEESAAKDDVMSYCRQRNIEHEEMINRFSTCNLDMIKNKVAPAIMSGGSSQIKNRSRCY